MLIKELTVLIKFGFVNRIFRTACSAKKLFGNSTIFEFLNLKAHISFP